MVNKDLMDNHQQELAEALSVRGHLAWTNVEGVQVRSALSSRAAVLARCPIAASVVERRPAS